IRWPDPETVNESAEYVALPGTPTLPTSISSHGAGSETIGVAFGRGSVVATGRLKLAVVETRQLNNQQDNRYRLVAYLRLRPPPPALHTTFGPRTGGVPPGRLQRAVKRISTRPFFLGPARKRGAENG